MDEKNMEQIMEKAQVLIEALPYIQRFNRKIIVVKYGGSAMVDEDLKKQVIQDVTLLKLVGFKPIIVHGGGKEISRWVGKVGKEPEFINGLRKTDAETMEIAEMVLNKVNKSLVSLVEGLGVLSIGISGKDGGLLKVKKKYSDAVRGKTVIQKHGNYIVVQNPPMPPLSTEELDKVYELPFMRNYHPSYEKLGGVPGIVAVKFSRPFAKCAAASGVSSV